VKTFLTRFCIFFAAAFFYSCGNALLNFTGENIPGGGGGEGGGGHIPVAGTTEMKFPYGASLIYIDTQAEFNKFCTIGLPGTEDYPLDGTYILRGNGVENRIFKASVPINNSVIFTGTLTGWYMPVKEEDEDIKTTIQMNIAGSWFKGTSMQAKEVSWLKFEAVNTNYYDAAEAVGIVAAEAVTTRFEQVTVVGNVTVSTQNLGNVLYAGGIVGNAGSGTTFDGCKARANISVSLENSSNHACYVGGIAGLLEGSVVNSSIATMQKSTYPPYAPFFNPISVKFTINAGNSNVYAGGVAGKLTGSIETTVVRANVTATGQAGAAYSGGYAGFAEGGTIKNNTSAGNLTVDATSGGVTNSGNAYAGGLVGKSTHAIVNNHLTGTVSVTSRYYDGASYSGGLAGTLSGTARIESSSINGSATIQSYSQAQAASPPGKAYAGGLVGYSDVDCTIIESSFTSNSYSGAVNAGFSNSYQTGAIAASEAYAGGIAGYALGEISKVYSNAQIDTSASSYNPDPAAGIDARISKANSTAAAGGITGKNEKSISESYAVVTVKARAMDGTTSTEGASAGGISGISLDSITNTFALAKVDASPVDNTVTNGKAQAGGITGYLVDNKTVTTSYAAGSVMAFGGTASVYAGGIAGYIDGSSTSLAIEKCVALQQYIASTMGSNNFHRIAGMLSSNRTISDTYAYSGMKPQNGGPPFAITPSASDENGEHISAADAKDLNFYTGTGSSLSWTSGSMWSAGSFSYPVLANLTTPDYVPAWAQIP
jgi:hypothetical protein